MRGYYTIVNGVPYELTRMPLTQESDIAGEELGHIECTPVPVDKSLTINITEANLQRSASTNKELSKVFLKHLKDIGVQQITKLSNHFTVYIEYALYDNICDEVVSRDVVVRECCPQSFLFPLGLTVNNEYVARFGFMLAAGVQQRFRQQYPMGMHHAGRGNSYTLSILRVWVTAVMERAWSLKPQHKPNPPFCNCHDAEGATSEYGDWRKEYGQPFGMRRLDCCDGVSGKHTYYHHPSCSDMSYSTKDFMLDPRDSVIIYDSLWSVDETGHTGPIYETNVRYAPEIIRINFTLKSIMLTLISQDDVAKVIEGNNTDVDTDDPERPDPDNPDTPTTPTPPSKNPEIDGDDKDHTGSNPDEGDNTGGSNPGEL